MKQILLLVGESGSGKDTVANILEEAFKLKILKSYTSRPMRPNEGNTHVFITPEEVDQFRDSMVAYTKFNNYEYFCTEAQLFDNDVYIIDPAGIEFLKSKMSNKNIEFISVYIHVPVLTRLYRMYKRGDGIKRIVSRFFNDLKMFKTIDYDYKMSNIKANKTACDIYSIYNVEQLLSEEGW